MRRLVPIDPPVCEEPLTVGERKRVSTLLASISTRTLLVALDSMTANREDARLIIAALLERFPAS